MSTASKNSFSSRATLRVGNDSFEIYRLDALAKAGVGNVARLPFSLKVLLENLLAPRGRPLRPRGRHSRPRRLGPLERRRERNLLHARARAAAGFHRRSGGRRSRRDARSDPQAWRRSEKNQSAASRRTRDRPLRASGQIRLRGRLRLQRRTRNAAQHRALRLPPLGTESLEEFQSCSAGHRHLPSGESRISRARRFQRRAGRQALRLPRFARRHRFAHHHGQRPRRVRLGRRRHRSGSRHARPAALDADSRTSSASSCTAACPKARRPPTWCSPSRRCCARKASSENSSSSTARAFPASRFPTAPPSPTWRPNTAPPWASSPSTRRRSPTCASPAAASAQVRLVEAYTKEQGIFRTDETPDPIFSDKLELDLATVVPTMAGPKRPQDSVPLTQAKVGVRKIAHRSAQARARAEQRR